ncbi:Gfo/Idh/MocA family protein [Flavobacterium sp. CS20]|jgi:predicted dehydrogenase|uniref:Gfo/Idh/MocA family protein n=1 Tax=Flavobacterium sp. CS20 TaxID=2775246 RepID=UPI001B3A19BE|nr:Gfo/Idh/MocA family oxidoreductase [Flavobacterium sp. CS20]QTY27851.1 Gfo/Idh/MocA family oxidoreductase [Flavobacterium sp. CS20]
MKTYKWGILGLGKIAHKFANDLQTVKNAELYAVGSRTQNKADEFATKHKASKAYGSYEQLIKDPDIDVVYIATPHVFHKANTIAVLKSGKAVLCEKAFAMNHNEVEDMIRTAQDNHVFLMEALWTNFMPTIKTIKEFQDKKTYGNIKNIQAEFCFKAPFDPNKRLFNPKLGGGSLLDIGIYPVYLALKLLGKPNHISAESKLSTTGVDLETKIVFEYNNNVKADLFCSFDQTRENFAFIEFEKAKIKLGPRFHETDKLSIVTNDKTIDRDFNYQAKGYHFEIAHVQECLEQGFTESPLMPFEFSLELIKTLDKIRAIVGLEYE